jgi:hypothetical protein
MSTKKKYIRVLTILFMLPQIQLLNAWPSFEFFFRYPKAVCSTIRATVSDIWYWRKPDTSFPTLDELNPVTFVPVGNEMPMNKSLQRMSYPADTAPKIVLKILKKRPIPRSTIIIRGKTYTVQSGILDDSSGHKSSSPLEPCVVNLDQPMPISVYHGGYSNEGKPYAYCGYTAIKSGLIPGACVTFDLATNTRRRFNFCNDQSIGCVKTVCSEIKNKQPKAPIILHGACQGATNNLRFLTNQNKSGDPEKLLPQIKAVIAESPSISTAKALAQTPFSWLTLSLMPYIFPHYNPNAPTIMDDKPLSGNIPVLIASLPKDTISDLSDVNKMKQGLSKGNNISLFVSKEEEIQHGQIGKALDYRKKARKFLETNNLFRIEE